ncbi:MAG: hypothetical protein KIT80_18130 [Chitinophagaceae bacterium]|nr:hypothetical protein [Chitinophagaceae bacterium]MCW5928844.1 hypothetical protein [Chitinophagaceae bacterium]
MNKVKITLLFILITGVAFGQNIAYKKQEFELNNVKASVVKLKGNKVLKIERDLKALPFDKNNMVSTVDEPTFAILKGVDFENGIIEVKVLSRLLANAPDFARGFIGVAFHIDDDNRKFQSIYIRPTNGRAGNQFRRNHTIQYFAYPDYKFDRLRKEFPETYETYADIGLDEWITLRLEIIDSKVNLYVNGQKHPSFIVEEMKGSIKKGSVALWVDIGTEGYFKDIKVIKK